MKNFSKSFAHCIRCISSSNDSNSSDYNKCEYTEIWFAQNPRDQCKHLVLKTNFSLTSFILTFQTLKTYCVEQYGRTLPRRNATDQCKQFVLIGLCLIRCNALKRRCRHGPGSHFVSGNILPCMRASELCSYYIHFVLLFYVTKFMSSVFQFNYQETN
jgi:hypothetical protein